ncbi:hypothetical protein D3C76_508520 [compost metagenome]
MDNGPVKSINARPPASIKILEPSDSGSFLKNAGILLKSEIARGFIGSVIT